MAASKSLKQTEDLVNNVFDILPFILELLPVRDAARTCVLSKQWQFNWLSLKRLVFDNEFYLYGRADWEECSKIISSILLHHIGPVHELWLYIPEDANDKCMYLGQLLSFLSKNEVRCTRIINQFNDFVQISSHIFWCSELIHLELESFTLSPLPSSFSGFPKLRHLNLRFVEFTQEDIFSTLMSKCRRLVTLTLNRLWPGCRGVGRIFVDSPHLETLFIFCVFEGESIALGDVCNLERMLVSGMPGKPLTIETMDAFSYLASLRQLQFVTFAGDFCKFFTRATIKRPVPVAFNHLNELKLDRLELSSLCVLQNIFEMVESCPNMKKLVIFIVRSRKNAHIHQKLDCTKMHKSPHLVEVKITCITVSCVELQLIEHLLTVGIALERLFNKSVILDTESQQKLSKVLLGIPRASPNACVVCLTKTMKSTVAIVQDSYNHLHPYL